MNLFRMMENDTFRLLAICSLLVICIVGLFGGAAILGGMWGVGLALTILCGGALAICFFAIIGGF